MTAHINSMVPVPEPAFQFFSLEWRPELVRVAVSGLAGSFEQTFDLVLAKQGDLFDGWQHPRWERLEDVLDEKSQVTEGGGNGSLGLVAGCQRGPPDLTAVTCAPITRVIRGIASEVEIGPEQGLPDRGVINCDNVITIPKTALEPSPVGFSTQGKRAELDRTLRYSLDVIY